MTGRALGLLACVVASLLAAGSAARAQSAPAPTTLAFVSTLTGTLSLTTTGLVQKPLRRAHDVGTYSWSPDGRRIAFTSSGVLHVVDADGSGLRRLPERSILGGITWAPDGRRIAYSAARGGSVNVFVLDVRGGRPHALTRSVPTPVLPSWSPRGSAIAFTSANSNFNSIYTVRVDGSGLRKLTDGREESFPWWSPDGRWLLYEPYVCLAGRCGYAISVMRPDGSGNRRLAHVPGAPGGGGLHAAWSPDSRRIAFLRLTRGIGSEIMVVDVDGSGLRKLAAGSRSGSYPAWSPDGRLIAYASGTSIRVMRPDGGGNRPFVEYAAAPSWQPARR